MWKLCGPGSTDVALYYWGKPVFSYSSGAWFSDPHTSTYWNNTYGRAYMMYLATQSYPPSFSSAGEEAYGAYPSAQTYVSDERDTLNWEASGHNTGNWSNYFYGIIWYNQMSSTTFYNDVIQDIWGSGVPPVVVVNAQLLPNWNNVSTTTSHSVAIVGYDATTFTYIDTCGVGCNNKGYANGFYTVLKSQMWAALQNDGTTGALIW